MSDDEYHHLLGKARDAKRGGPGRMECDVYGRKGCGRAST